MNTVTNILPNHFIVNKVVSITEEKLKELELICDEYGSEYLTSSKYEDYYFKVWNSTIPPNVLVLIKDISYEPYYHILIIPKKMP